MNVNNMSAQYRPYRNEDGMETDPVSWGDQEMGDVEIYQKTTEDIRVVSNKNLVVGGIGIAIVGALVGLLVGYFAHSEHTECVPSLAVALHSIQEENPYIRKKVQSMVSKDSIKGYLEKFSSEPHMAGSDVDRRYASQIKNDWLKNGLDKVDIINYTVLLSFPDAARPNVIKIIDDQNEMIMYFQNTGRKKTVPAFSAYSRHGNVTGELVYVNYGRHADFQYLKDHGINLQNKILIARQYFLAPDDQAWNAQQVGAAGLLLYPDPESYSSQIPHTKPYPYSWWLPGDAARSDSVLWNGVGDPLTPGYPAQYSTSRLPLDSAVLPRILVQPVSYDDAYKLLSSLDGLIAPKEWQGQFNFTYKIGSHFKNPKWKLYMEVNNKFENKTIHNVIGYIKGKTEPDRYIIIGSHRDSWGYGAVDSAAGTAALLELSRVYGQLLKQGWRPRRTMMFCSWGAEKYNLIGSTEWLEENLKVLHGRAVAYINTDVLVTGNISLSAAGSPLLYNAIFNATKEVSNPNIEELLEGLHTVYDAWLHTFPLKRNSSNLLFPEHVHSVSLQDYEDLEALHALYRNHSSLLENYIKNAMQGTRPLVKKMDMLSNYAPFFSYAGIPALDICYVTEAKQPSFPYPLYNTEYDDFNLIKNFIDPSFDYHSTVVKVLGELLRDLSDSLFLPFNLFDYAQVLRDYYITLHSSAKQLLDDQSIDIFQLDSAIKNFTEAAYRFHAMQESVDLSDPMTVRRINDQLLLLERAFLDPSGLPRNMYKRHIVLSPGEGSFHYMDDIFPGLMDEFANLNADPKDDHSIEIIRTHLSILIFTINSATATIKEV